MEANVARVHAERPRLAAALAEVGWDPQPSVTNFLLARPRDRRALRGGRARADGAAASCRGRSATATRSPTASA